MQELFIDTANFRSLHATVSLETKKEYYAKQKTKILEKFVRDFYKGAKDFSQPCSVDTLDNFTDWLLVTKFELSPPK